ncbi:MAG: S9 family peptidase [Bacteroidales bacterium]|nr:S9 family peptidase [Bacteroidales bacterium]
MKRILFLLAFTAMFMTQCTQPLEKPALATVNPVENEYWGVSLTDPYQYMENLEDTIVKNWMIANADYARSILDGISGRNALIEKMQEFDQRVSDRTSNLTILDNDRYFYLKTTPEDETGKLFVRDGFDGAEKLLFDPQTYGDDSLDYVIGSISPTFAGDKVAFTVTPNGSENTTMLILDMESGKFYPEDISLSLGGASWLADGEHFFYTKVNSEDVHDPGRYLNTKSYLHKLGSFQQEDRVFFSGEKYPELRIKPQEFPFAIYDHYGDKVFMGFFNVERYMTLFVTDGKEVHTDRVIWRSLCTMKDEIQNFYPKEDELYVYTAKGAPNFRVLKTSLAKPEFENAEVFIPEPEEGVLNDFVFTNTACYFTVKVNGTETKLYKREDAGISEVEIPVAAGSVYVRTKGHKFQDIWVSLTGWTLDGIRYRYHPDDSTFTVEQLSKTAEYPEYADMVVEEIMVPSHDGVEVPLSLIYRKGLKRDGSAPLMVYGYGSYGITNDPGFSPNRMLWCFDGGIWAVAHVRGGGALGESWRLAGYKTSKPNTWKDLIAVTEYLHRESYSSPEHTAILGGSAGGILVGRAMTDCPDLFKVVLPMVGAMNNVRMEESPNGPINIPEFGTVKDSLEFLALLEMDSYHHLEDGVEYPATLVTAGMNDPRVIAWQPGKFAARLQAANASDNPILFLVDYKAGHGIGNTKSKNWEDMADYFSFAFWQTGHPKYKR